MDALVTISLEDTVGVPQHKITNVKLDVDNIPEFLLYKGVLYSYDYWEDEETMAIFDQVTEHEFLNLDNATATKSQTKS